MRLLFALLLITITGTAQLDSIPEVTHTIASPSTPNIYYFPIYNDTQLVEIDVFNHTVRQGSWMNQTVPRGGSWYADAVSADQTNWYVLRNGRGEIIKQYGGVSVEHTGFNLLPPATAPTITHKERLNQKKAQLGDVQLTWKDANGYGYRYSEPRINEQKTEMPEMPYEVYGMIDTLGRIVIPPDNYKITYLEGEYLVIRAGGGYSMYNSHFDCVLSQNYGSIKRLSAGIYAYYNNGAWIVDANGKLLDSTRYTDVRTNQYNDMFIYHMEEGSKKKFGVLSANLEVVIPPKYTWLKAMSHGFLGFYQSSTAAIISPSGKQLTGFDFNQYRVGYQDGYYLAQMQKGKEKYYGIIDTIGDTLIPFKYESVSYFEGNLNKVFLNNKWGLVNRKGEELTPVKYDYMGDLKGEYIMVQDQNNWGLINSKGEELLEPKYFGISCFNTDYIFYRNDDKQWHLLNGKTKKTKKLGYDQVYCFNWKYTRVIKNEKYGLIDHNGKEVLKVEYDGISLLKNDQLLIRKGKYYGIMNTDLIWVKPLKYKSYEVTKDDKFKVL